MNELKIGCTNGIDIRMRCLELNETSGPGVLSGGGVCPAPLFGVEIIGRQ